MCRLTAALAAAALLLALIPSPAGAGRPLGVLFDTLVGNQVYPCGARLIEGGTTNGSEKQAASFTVEQPATVTRVVLPLSVETVPAKIEVKIVAGVPWDSSSLGTGFWNNLPDESAVIGRSTTVMVSVLQQPCGQPEILTATFKKPVSVSPGIVYWVLLANPAGGTSTFSWINGTAIQGSSTFAQFVIGSFYGDLWLSYPPGTWRDSAMRVLGKVSK